MQVPARIELEFPELLPLRALVMAWYLSVCRSPKRPDATFALLLAQRWQLVQTSVKNGRVAAPKNSLVVTNNIHEHCHISSADPAFTSENYRRKKTHARASTQGSLSLRVLHSKMLPLFRVARSCNRYQRMKSKSCSHVGASIGNAK